MAFDISLVILSTLRKLFCRVWLLEANFMVAVNTIDTHFKNKKPNEFGNELSGFFCHFRSSNHIISIPCSQLYLFFYDTDERVFLQLFWDVACMIYYIYQIRLILDSELACCLKQLPYHSPNTPSLPSILSFFISLPSNIRGPSISPLTSEAFLLSPLKRKTAPVRNVFTFAPILHHQSVMLHPQWNNKIRFWSHCVFFLHKEYPSMDMRQNVSSILSKVNWLLLQV